MRGVHQVPSSRPHRGTVLALSFSGGRGSQIGGSQLLHIEPTAGGTVMNIVVTTLVEGNDREHSRAPAATHPDLWLLDCWRHHHAGEHRYRLAG